MSGILPTLMAAVPPNAFSIHHLDRWVRFAVLMLRQAGIQTYESCQGGAGHAFPEPTVRFEGTKSDAFRAVAAVRAHGLPAHHLRQFWRLNEHGAERPAWEMTFYPLTRLVAIQRQAERHGLMRRAVPSSK